MSKSDDAGRPKDADEAPVDTGPPISRAVAMFAIVIIGFALVATVAWFIGGGGDGLETRYCTADGRIDPQTGAMYSRDPEQGCLFVDQEGVPIPDQ